MSQYGPDKAWTDLIDEFQVANPPGFNAFPLRPSAAGQCARKLAYDLSSYEGFEVFEKEPIPPNRQRIFDLGHSVEYHTINQFYRYMKDKPDLRVTYKQQTVTLFRLDPVDGKESPIVEGSIDLAIKWGEHLYILDVKSAGTFFSAAYKDRWEEQLVKLDRLGSTQRLPVGAKSRTTGFWVENLRHFLNEIADDPFLTNNFVQLNLYCTSQFAQDRRVAAGSIIKYSKNDSRWYEIRFKPDPTLAEEFRAKANHVYKTVMTTKSAEKVQREYALGSKNCNYCDYLSKCWPKAEKWKYRPKNPATKISSVEGSAPLRKMFEEYLALEQSTTQKGIAELKVLHAMDQKGLQKVELDNGDIFEVKSYKTGGPKGGPRLALKRSKN